MADPIGFNLLQDDLSGLPQDDIDLDEILKLQEQLRPTLEEPTPEGPTYGLLETAARAASRGFTRLGSTFGDLIPAMGSSWLANRADDIGLDALSTSLREYALGQLEEARATEEEIAQMNPAEFQSYKEVSSPYEALRFAFQVAPEQFANLAAVIGTSVVTKNPFTSIASVYGRKAALKKLGATQLPKAVSAEIGKKAASRGLMASTGLGSFALNAPEVFNNIYDATGSLSPGMAILGGGVAASLDSVLPYQITKSFTLNPALKKEVVRQSLLKSGANRSVLAGAGLGAVKGVLKGAPIEGVTEAAQEGVSVVAERIVGENWESITSEESDRIIESAVQGAVGGGGISSVAGTIEGGLSARAKKAARDLPATPETLASVVPGQQDLRALVTDKTDPEQVARLVNLGLTTKDIDNFGENISPNVEGKYSIGQLNRVVANKTKYLADRQSEEVAQDIETHREKEDNPREKMAFANEVGFGFIDDAAIDAFEVASQDPVTQLTSIDFTDQNLEYIANREPGPAVAGEPTVNLFSAKDVRDLVAAKKATLNPVTPEAKDHSGVELWDVDRDIEKAQQTPAAEVVVSEEQNLDEYYDLERANAFAPGSKNLDLSSGRYRGVSRALSDKGVTNFRFDPVEAAREEGRIEEGEQRITEPELRSNVDQVRDGQVDTATIFGQLDALENVEDRMLLLERAKNALKENGELLVTSNKKPLKTYIPEIAEVFNLSPDAISIEKEGDTSFIRVAKAPVIVNRRGVRDRVDDFVEKPSVEEMLEPQFAPVIDGLGDYVYAWNAYKTDQTNESREAYEAAERALLKIVKDGSLVPDPFRQTLAIRDGEFTVNLDNYLAFSSMAASAPVTYTSVERLNEVVSELYGPDAAIRSRIEIFNSPADVPGRTDLNPGAQGIFTTDNRIYLFAENIEVGNEVGVVMHETGGHLGILTQYSQRVITSLYKSINNFATGKDSFESEVANFAKERVKLAKTPPELAEMETVAYFIEEAVNRGIDPTTEAKVSGPLGSFFKRLVKLFKQALRAIGIAVPTSAKDIVDMAYGAAKKPLKLPMMKLTNIERDLYSIPGIDQVPAGSAAYRMSRLAKFKNKPRAKHFFDKARFYLTELPMIGWEIRNEYAYSSEPMQQLAAQLASEVKLIDRLNNERLGDAQRYLEGERVVTYVRDGETQFSPGYNYTASAERKRKRFIKRLQQDENVDNSTINTREEGWFVANIKDEGAEVQSRMEKPDWEEFQRISLEASRLQVSFFEPGGVTFRYTKNGEPQETPYEYDIRQVQESFDTFVKTRKDELERDGNVDIDSIIVDRQFNFVGRNDEDTRSFRLNQESRQRRELDELKRKGANSVAGSVKEVLGEKGSEDYESFKKRLSSTNIEVKEIEQFLGEKPATRQQRAEIYSKAVKSFMVLNLERTELMDTLVQYFNNLSQRDAALAQQSIGFLTSYESSFTKMFNTLDAELTKSFGETTAIAIMEAANIRRDTALKPFFPLTREGPFHLRAEHKDRPYSMAKIHHRKTEKEILELRKELEQEGATVSIQADLEKEATPETAKSLNIMQEKLTELGLDNAAAEKVAVLLDETRSMLLPLSAFEERTRLRRGYPGYEPQLIDPLIKIANASANQLAAFQAKTELNQVFASAEKIVQLMVDEGLKPVAAKGEAVTYDEDTKKSLQQPWAPAPGSITFAQDVLKELQKRRAYMENPVNSRLANIASIFTFRYFLAGTPSSPVVNTTSTWTIGVGALGEEYGFKDTMRELSKATAIAMRNGFKRISTEGEKYTAGATDARVLDDLTLFDEDFIYQNTEMRELAIDSKVSGTDRASFRPDVEKIADLDLVTNKVGQYFRMTMTALGWMFQQSERVSKQIVLKAAYELERNRQRDLSKKSPEDLAAYLGKQKDDYARITERERKTAERDEDPETPYEGRRLHGLSLLDKKYDSINVNSPLAKELARRIATDFVFRIQSTGIRASASRALQGNFGKVIGSLRSYALLMMSLQSMIGVLGFRGAKAAFKRTKFPDGVKGPGEVAFKLFLYTSVPTFMLAGIQGLPMYFVPEFFYGMMQAMDGDDEFEADETFDEFMANMLGAQSDVGHLAFVGPFSHLTDVSIYRRVGFNDLFMQDDPYKQERLGMPAYIAESSLGAAVAILNRGIRGISAFAEGEYREGLTTAAPKVVSDILLGTDPKYGYTRKGDRLLEDVGAKERITKVLGFGSTQTRVNSLGRQRMFRLKRKASDRKQSILLKANTERLSAGLLSSATQGAIARFNRSGFSKIKGVGSISRDTLKRSWNNFNDRRRVAEYSARKYNITYPGLSMAEVDTLAAEMGLGGTLNLNY